MIISIRYGTVGVFVGVLVLETNVPLSTSSGTWHRHKPTLPLAAVTLKDMAKKLSFINS
jgi:hypothetical protein